jgi:GrpB-like predicted nucleotidyltransferase (UPF0157 family)
MKTMIKPTKPDDSVPTSEEQLRKATVGELKQLNGPIEIAEYNPAWPALFDQEATRIRSALGKKVLGLEHVGSTSIPGMAAKPKIDILLVVVNTADELAYVPALEAVGYVLRNREPDWHEHRMFVRRDADINLHSFSEGCIEIERMLKFRDWLRTHKHDRLLYERTKRELAAKTWKYVQDYADAKTSIVKEILSRVSS